MADSSRDEERISSDQFNFHSWYYWSIWWKQFMYWQYYLSQSNTTPPLVNTHQIPTWYSQFNQQRINIRIQLTTGFETYIAPLWRRLIAEVLDTLLICGMLKFFFPMLNYSIPDVIFYSPDEILELSEEELKDVMQMMFVFLLSLCAERSVHALMEFLFTYHFGCTPGKWIMGLRIFNCTSVHYTNTDPLRTIKIEPGTRMSIGQAVLRTAFKSAASMFCPLILFLLVTDRRPQTPLYDASFKTIVVYYRYMYRPT